MPPSVASEREGVPREQALPVCYHDSPAVRAREALALSFVDEELAPWAIPERIYARKPYTSACERPPIRYLASNAGAASKSCRAVSRTRHRPRPRKKSSTRSRVRRALEPKTSPSRPRRPRPSLPVVALYSFKPGLRFPMHSSVRNKRKRRRELLLGKASRAGRHEELPIIVNGAEVRARHWTHRLLCGSCCIRVRPYFWHSETPSSFCWSCLFCLVGESSWESSIRKGPRWTR
jgi:hypothetical protein